MGCELVHTGIDALPTVYCCLLSELELKSCVLPDCSEDSSVETKTSSVLWGGSKSKPRSGGNFSFLGIIFPGQLCWGII